MSHFRMQRVLLHSRCLFTGLNTDDRITVEVFQHQMDSNKLLLFPTLRNSDF